MNEQLTFEDLRAYQAGLLSGQERHRVERILIEDPFYADALSGLEAMQTTATPTADQLNALRSALDKRIRASATKKRLWPLWIATTTAAILFVLAMAIYFIFFAPRGLAPKQTPKQKPVNGIKATIQPTIPYRSTQTVFTFTNSLMPASESSRPKPEFLMPPNGTRASERIIPFTNTDPA